MSRIRYIKPGFWRNDRLAECSFQARLLFIGLWNFADRDGFVENRHKRIKADVFPYDDCDVPGLLSELEGHGFIATTNLGGEEVIQIANWHRHQRPHHQEAPSRFATDPDEVRSGSEQNAIKCEVDQDSPEELPEETQVLENKGLTTTSHQNAIKRDKVRTASEPIRQEREREQEQELKLEQIERTRTAQADLSDLSDLEIFWGNLSDAGMALPSSRPSWLAEALRNGQRDHLLAASREIANTGLLEGRQPCHLGNFKNEAWVKRVASGDFNKPGIPARTPEVKPANPDDEWLMFQPAGKRMRRREIKEWLKDPANMEVFQAYQERYGKVTKHPAPPVPEGTKLQRPDLSLPPDVDTATAKKNALAQIAKWQGDNEPSA